MGHQFLAKTIQTKHQVNWDLMYLLIWCIRPSLQWLDNICLDSHLFGISLHFIAAHNDPNSVAGLGLAFTTVNVLLIPMALGI